VLALPSHARSEKLPNGSTNFSFQKRKLTLQKCITHREAAACIRSGAFLLITEMREKGFSSVPLIANSTLIAVDEQVPTLGTRASGQEVVITLALSLPRR
jgi:hypothetical protein